MEPDLKRFENNYKEKQRSAHLGNKNGMFGIIRSSSHWGGRGRCSRLLRSGRTARRCRDWRYRLR